VSFKDGDVDSAEEAGSKDSLKSHSPTGRRELSPAIFRRDDSPSQERSRSASPGEVQRIISHYRKEREANLPDRAPPPRGDSRSPSRERNERSSSGEWRRRSRTPLSRSASRYRIWGKGRKGKGKGKDGGKKGEKGKREQQDGKGKEKGKKSKDKSKDKGKGKGKDDSKGDSKDGKKKKKTRRGRGGGTPGIPGQPGDPGKRVRN